MQSTSSSSDKTADVAQQPPHTNKTKRELDLPYIKADLAAGVIEIQGEVCWQPNEVCDWLELIACSPQSREYESLISTPAKPSHIHLALLTMGLQNGNPQKLIKRDKKWETIPAQGDTIEITVRYTDPDTQKVTVVPVTNWVKQRGSTDTIQQRHWLFTGSAFATDLEGKPQYMADMNGTVISLVHFGDDLLASPSNISSSEDKQMYQANADVLPPYKTPVTIIIKRSTVD